MNRFYLLEKKHEIMCPQTVTNHLWQEEKKEAEDEKKEEDEDEKEEEEEV